MRRDLVAGINAGLCFCATAVLAFEPVSSYELQDIEGWPVYVNRALIGSDKSIHAKALKELRIQLYRINRMVPRATLEVLHEVAIWFEAESSVTCACHHPSKKWLENNDFNPEKAKAVEIGSPENFVNWTRHTQPWMVMHELAHAFQQRAVGYKDAELLGAYQAAVDSGSYESVLHINGKKRRAYALNNQMEYFAELSEAYFGRNDFYPFVRSEIEEHDPEGYKVLKRLWEAGVSQNQIPDQEKERKSAASKDE